MNTGRLHKALIAIFTAVGLEHDRGFGGVCIELETLHLNIRGSIRPYTPEEMEIVVRRTVRMFEHTHTIKYYGSHTYLPEGCQVGYNAKGAWVGHLLVLDMNH